MPRPRLHLDADASQRALFEALLKLGHDVTRKSGSLGQFLLSPPFGGSELVIERDKRLLQDVAIEP